MRLVIGWLALMVMLAAIGSGVMQGCITTTDAEGNVTQQMDVAAVQLALDFAREVWQRYQDEHPGDTSSETAMSLQERVDYWLGILARLQELKAAGVKDPTVDVPKALVPAVPLE